MAEPVLTPGRIIISIANLIYSIGAFLADFNYTHVYNPRWPPHARFHNGQTMTLGVLLCSMSVYLAFVPVIQRGSKARIDAQTAVLYSAIVGSFYCTAGCSAILYPGTEWKDPDIDVGGEQKYIFSGQVILIWVGYALEMSRMAKSKAA